MAVTLHRCSHTWVKIDGHACWRVEKALQEAGVAYEVVTGPTWRGKRSELIEQTGQPRYPAIELEDGSWYREESKDMVETIRAGRLLQPAGS